MLRIREVVPSTGPLNCWAGDPQQDTVLTSPLCLCAKYGAGPGEFGHKPSRAAGKRQVQGRWRGWAGGELRIMMRIEQ